MGLLWNVCARIGCVFAPSRVLSARYRACDDGSVCWISSCQRRPHPVACTIGSSNPQKKVDVGCGGSENAELDFRGPSRPNFSGDWLCSCVEGDPEAVAPLPLVCY